MITAWRIVKRKRARAAFTGEGARRYGGRRNSAGVSIVYTAESQSLAALEMVVHLDSSELLDRYVVFEVGRRIAGRPGRIVKATRKLESRSSTPQGSRSWRRMG